jgi:hypothetical protein
MTALTPLIGSELLDRGGPTAAGFNALTIRF